MNSIWSYIEGLQKNCSAVGKDKQFFIQPVKTDKFGCFTVGGDVFVGVDLSLTQTGLAIMVGGSGHMTPHVATCVIKPPKGQDKGIARLLFFRNFFSQLAAYLSTTSGSVHSIQMAVEGYAMGARGHAFNIGEQGGLFRCEMASKRLPFIVVPPNNLKKFATGSGASSGKGVIVKDLYRKYQVNVDNDNAADAALLALMAAVFYNVKNSVIQEKITAYERDSLQKVEAFSFHRNLPR